MQFCFQKMKTSSPRSQSQPRNFTAGIAAPRQTMRRRSSSARPVAASNRSMNPLIISKFLGCEYLTLVINCNRLSAILSFEFEFW